MISIIHLVFLLLGVPLVFSQTNPYCLLEKCPAGSHTLCQYSEHSPDDRCGENVSLVITPEEKSEIYSAHARIKKRIENYWIHVLGLSYSAASRKPILDWDDELTKAAQAWANQCKNSIDQCRNVARFSVDQRVGVSQVYNSLFDPSYSNIIEDWYHADPMTEYVRNSSIATDRTVPRSLWESATKFGCGSLKSYCGLKTTLYFVCNYAPVDYEVAFDPSNL